MSVEICHFCGIGLSCFLIVQMDGTEMNQSRTGDVMMCRNARQLDYTQSEQSHKN